MQRPGCQPTWPSWRRDVWPSPYRRASGPALAASAHAGTRVGEPSGDRSTARRTGPPPGRPVDRNRPTGRPVPATGRRGTGSRSNSTGDPVDRYWPTGRHCTGDGRQCRSTGRPVPVDRPVDRSTGQALVRPFVCARVVVFYNCLGRFWLLLRPHQYRYFYPVARRENGGGLELPHQHLRE